ncbi:hypothetical protein Tsubulata_038709 [Turnera subulata]|uniref:DC1 domain-containing protein n=1 Tax=Turnera subulata TaxID=218843 RepID=A0A9Q0GEK8_9ROSI|nr:hypothetical protein Tsubulata_038709 [Turnera subulata]
MSVGYIYDQPSLGVPSKELKELKEFKGMGIKHWSHQHDGLQLEIYTNTLYNPWTSFCYGCSKRLRVGDPYYFCRELDCYFRLCESCFESSYPPQVRHHPLHPPHPLVLVLLSGNSPDGFMRKDYTCDGCDCLSTGFVYRCEEGCDFKLDVGCAILMNSQIIEPSKPRAARRTKQHYIHPDHHLTLFTCKLPDIHCTLCGDEIIGAAYGCCECRAYLHESCSELTLEIRHPYHWNHPLRSHKPGGVENPDGYCGACRAGFASASGIFYQCLICRARLHTSCVAKSLFTAPMKHEGHEHWIHYVNEKNWRSRDIEYQCDACKTDCETSYYKKIRGTGARCLLMKP